MTGLPANWSVKPLGEVSVVNPRRPRQLLELPEDHQVTFVNMAAVDQTTGTITTSTVRPFSQIRRGFTYFENDDVIFAKITPCMQNGKSAVARGLANGLGMGSTEFHVFRPIAGEVLPEWIWYFVRQPDLLREATRHFRGAVGQQRVPAAFMAGQKVPVPPLDEQRRIVARIREAMERVDELRRLREESRTASKALPQAARFEAFNSQAPTVTLGSIIGSGPTNGLYKHSKFYGDGTAILRINNFNGGDVLRSNTQLRQLQADATELTRFGLKEDDIVLNRVNGSLEVVGKACLIGAINEPLVFESNMMRFQVDKSKADPRYVLHFLASPQCRDQIKSKARVIQQASINQKDVKSFGLPLPDLNEQRRVADHLDAVASRGLAMVNEVFHAATALEALPGAILRKAFAGEL